MQYNRDRKRDKDSPTGAGRYIMKAEVIKKSIEEMDYEGMREEDGERAYLYHVDVDGVNIPVLDLFAKSGEETIAVPKDWNEDVEDIEDIEDIEWIDASEVE